MKPAMIPLLLALSAGPALAETKDTPPPDGDIGAGADLLGRGAQLFFRGLMDEVEPAMRDMAEALSGLEYQGLGIRDLDDYHAPEVLPNGDILLRRKIVLPPPGEGEIDL